ncbi:hypothetical protein BH09BAC2_BH09BAC2_11720 [soil metagenome]
MTTLTNSYGFLHNEWLRALDFYEQELSIFKNRLEEITNNNVFENSDVTAYKDQFLIRQKDVDDLKHLIMGHAQKISDEFKQNADKLNANLVADHKNIGIKIKQFEKKITDLRYNFDQYLNQWM